MDNATDVKIFHDLLAGMPEFSKELFTRIFQAGCRQRTLLKQIDVYESKGCCTEESENELLDVLFELHHLYTEMERRGFPLPLKNLFFALRDKDLKILKKCSFEAQSMKSAFRNSFTNPKDR